MDAFIRIAHCTGLHWCLLGYAIVPAFVTVIEKIFLHNKQEKPKMKMDHDKNNISVK